MKKLKRLLAVVCSLALVAALAVGNMGIVALAVTGGGEDTADYKFSVEVAESVVYGQAFAVNAAEGYTVKVTDPSGKETAVESGKVTANQLGNYVVTYSKDGMVYTFKVNSKMEDTYELCVGEVVNGILYTVADIPTYAGKGTEYNIPSAYLVKTENGVSTVVGEKIAPALSGVANEKTDKGYKFTEAGTAFVRYETTVAGGSKVLSKDYEIQVQSALKDDRKPTITVTNFPKTAQLKSKLTLPTATVSDDYDKTVKVEISVKDPNGNSLKEAVVDEKTGFATSFTENAIYFDAAANKTYVGEGKTVLGGTYFYPATKGDYKVTYKAVDDAGNAADVLEYTVAVSDGKAPVITFDATTLPTNWGWKSVKNKTEELADNSIVFGMPEFYDNDTATAELVVTLTVTDPQGKTVARFDNINTDKDVEYTSTNSVFKTAPKYTFKADAKSFTFDIKSYVEAIKSSMEEAKETYSYAVTGNYSVVYTAKDKTGNTASTSTYYINVVEDYADETEPTVTVNNAPERVVVKKGATFTVPAATFYSKEDSNLTTSYTLTSGEKSIDVKSEEVLDCTDTKIGELEVTGETVTLTATAKSAAGNVTTKEITIKVVKASAKELSYDVVLVKNEDADLRCGVGEINYGTLKIGDIPASEVKNVGVELGIKTSEGIYLTQFSAEIYWADNTKIVRNITFIPTTEGTYYLEVRVFDVYGNNSVRMYPIEVAPKADSDSRPTGPSAGTLPTSANIYTTVELVNSTFTLNNYSTYVKAADEDVYLATAHEISGGRFSLMGEEFVMMTAGTYKVTDKPLIVTTTDYTKDYQSSAAGYEAWLNSYAIEKKSIIANQDSNITFETVGASVPAYVKEVNSEVTLPAMVAYNSVENAKKEDVKVEVTHSSGVEMKVTEQADGTYTFKPNSNGSYTVKYTASVGGSSDTVSFTVKVGDINAPEFTVAEHAKTAKVGAKFEFNAIELTDKSETGVTVLKTLSKDGSTKATVKSLSGKGENITLDAAGTYEVTYEVTDKNGNVSTKRFTITVTEASANTVSTIMVVTIVLIVVAVALIAGIVVYLIVSRKKKTTK